MDAILPGPLGKLRGFDSVGADVVTFDGELIREAHGPRTVGSSGSNEYFEVEGLSQLRKLLPARGKQT